MLTFEKEFKRAVSFTDFLNSIPTNRTLFKSNYEEFIPDQKTIDFFRSINDFKIMVIGEFWCKDTVNELPLLAKLADLCDIDLGILNRDDNIELMDKYFLTDGKRRIPVFVFLNKNFVEIARWIERPRKIDEILHSGAEAMRSLGAAKYKQLVRDKTVREITELLRQKTTSISPNLIK